VTAWTYYFNAVRTHLGWCEMGRGLKENPAHDPKSLNVMDDGPSRSSGDPQFWNPKQH
jgi:hypothetical protein